MKSTKGIEIDLNEKSKLFEAIQEHGHLVGHYFDLRSHISSASWVQCSTSTVIGTDRNSQSPME